MSHHPVQGQNGHGKLQEGILPKHQLLMISSLMLACMPDTKV